MLFNKLYRYNVYVYRLRKNQDSIILYIMLNMRMEINELGMQNTHFKLLVFKFTII